LLFSAAVQAAGAYAMGGLGIQQPVDSARQRGIVGAMMIFGIGFSLGVSNSNLILFLFRSTFSGSFLRPTSFVRRHIKGMMQSHPQIRVY
jgi:hypothetical protein